MSKKIKQPKIVKPKFTAGDWQVMPGASQPRICVEGDKEWAIVVTISGHSSAGIKANEILIAASPKMYKTFERIIGIATDTTAPAKERLEYIETVAKVMLADARGDKK